MNTDPQQCTDPAASSSQFNQGETKEPSPYQTVKEATAEQLKQAASNVKESGKEALQTAKQASSHFLDEQKDKIAAKIDRYTEAVKSACETLETTEANPLVSPAHRASRQMERVSEYLRSRSMMDFLGDMGDLARRRPEIVFGSLFVAGLASVRFLKASAREQRAPKNANVTPQPSYDQPSLYPA